jgi:hypothetical protein
MKTMHSTLNLASFVAGFASGVLWLCAAWVKVPTALGSAYGGVIDGLDEMRKGFRKQAIWNSAAAAMTAVAAVLQAFAQLA